MKRLVVNNKGEVLLDEQFIDKKSLDYDFLNKIMTLCLKKEIIFELDENQYISTLFKKIEDECKEGSAFYNEWFELEQKAALLNSETAVVDSE